MVLAMAILCAIIAVLLLYHAHHEVDSVWQICKLQKCTVMIAYSFCLSHPSLFLLPSHPSLFFPLYQGVAGKGHIQYSITTQLLILYYILSYEEALLANSKALGLYITKSLLILCSVSKKKKNLLFFFCSSFVASLVRTPDSILREPNQNLWQPSQNEN